MLFSPVRINLHLPRPICFGWLGQWSTSPRDLSSGSPDGLHQIIVQKYWRDCWISIWIVMVMVMLAEIFFVHIPTLIRSLASEETLVHSGLGNSYWPDLNSGHEVFLIYHHHDHNHDSYSSSSDSAESKSSYLKWSFADLIQWSWYHHRVIFISSPDPFLHAFICYNHHHLIVIWSSPMIIISSQGDHHFITWSSSSCRGRWAIHGLSRKEGNRISWCWIF